MEAQTKTQNRRMVLKHGGAPLGARKTHSEWMKPSLFLHFVPHLVVRQTRRDGAIVLRVCI